jgi:hypothetical protein
MKDLFILYSILNDHGQLSIEYLKRLSSRNSTSLLRHNSLRY